MQNWRVVVLVIYLSWSWRSDGTLEACICALCFDSAISNCSALRVEQCLQHSLLGRMLSHWWVGLRTHVEQLQPFGQGCIIGLWKAGLLHMLGTMYQWCVAALSSGLWNILTPVDQVLDGLTFCKQGWPPKQHPGKKFGYMLHLLCHQGPLGTVCLQEDSDHMYLWPGYHLHYKAPVRMATLVSWKSWLENGMALCCLQFWE